MKKAIVICIVSVVVLSIAACVTLYKLGDSILEAAIEKDLKVLTEVSGEEVPLQHESNGEIGTDESSKEDKGSEDTKESSTNVTNENIPSTSDKKDIGKPNNIQKEKPPKITVEMVEEIKDKVSATDKMTAAALVVKRLSPSDISELQKMASDGLSPAEEKKAKQIAYEKFSQDEIKRIKELYKKYMKK